MFFVFYVFVGTATVLRDGQHEIDWSHHSNLENVYLKNLMDKVEEFKPIR